jgi:hypothetical protein
MAALKTGRARNPETLKIWYVVGLMDVPANIELSTIYKAFDGASEVTRHGYDTDNPVSTDVGRVRLANALLSAYRRGLTDPEDLKAGGIGPSTQ